MRTTLQIDDDVLMAVKELARHDKRSAGAVLSDMARRGLTAPRRETTEPVYRNGFRIISRHGGIVTNELIDHVREEEGI